MRLRVAIAVEKPRSPYTTKKAMKVSSVKVEEFLGSIALRIVTKIVGK